MRRSFGAKVIHIVYRISTEVTQILFPVHCVGCKVSNVPLCSTCASRIARAEPSPDLITAWSFRDPRVRTLIHHLKYRGRTVVVRVCAEALSERLTEEISEKITYGTFQDPLIVPIPLHPTRKRSRGYNQAELLARALAETASFSCAYEQNVLKRIKDTPAQARIKDRRKRARNIIGAFALHPGAQQKIVGRDIILIDDVATTGATLREAEKVLKCAGAREVLLAAVAH